MDERVGGAVSLKMYPVPEGGWLLDIGNGTRGMAQPYASRPTREEVADFVRVYAWSLLLEKPYHVRSHRSHATPTSTGTTFSTYHYLYCEKCHHACPLGSCSASSGKIGPLAGDEWLRGFAVAHAGHTLLCVTEYDDAFLDNAVMVDEAPNERERLLSLAAEPKP